MDQPRLSRIVIKPTFACTSDCHFCSSRRSLHKSLQRSKIIALETWGKVLAEAKALGAEYFVISGGEPFLYRQLVDLVKLGKKNNLAVTINTNGYLVTEKRVQTLLDAGLDSVCISIHSHRAEVHDAMKLQPGVWAKATEAVRIFARLTKNHPTFSLHTQAIISRENHLEFPELVQMHYELGAQQMRLSYLDGDFDQKHVLTQKEILEFKEKSIPKAMKFCQRVDPVFKKEIHETLSNLYSEKFATLDEFAHGYYRPESRSHEPCCVPSAQALILANGDVHPCNIVEYTHEPVMGNLYEKSLTEIWNGEVWNEFRQHFFDRCKFCPVNIDPHLTFRQKPLTVRRFFHRYLPGTYQFLKSIRRAPLFSQHSHSSRN